MSSIFKHKRQLWKFNMCWKVRFFAGASPAAVQPEGPSLKREMICGKFSKSRATVRLGEDSWSNSRECKDDHCWGHLWAMGSYGWRGPASECSVIVAARNCVPSGSGSFVEGEDLQAQRPAIRVKIAELIQDEMIQLQSALLRTCSWAVKELSNLVADLVYLGVGWSFHHKNHRKSQFCALVMICKPFCQWPPAMAWKASNPCKANALASTCIDICNGRGQKSQFWLLTRFSKVLMVPKRQSDPHKLLLASSSLRSETCAPNPRGVKAMSSAPLSQHRWTEICTTFG